MNEISLPTLAALIALLSVFSGLLLLALKVMFGGLSKHLDDSLAESRKRVEEALTETKVRTEAVEKEILKIKLDLAEEYVRREDWIRFSTLVTSKIDRLGDQLDGVRKENRCVAAP